jgi:hypothetical protein
VARNQIRMTVKPLVLANHDPAVGVFPRTPCPHESPSWSSSGYPAPVALPGEHGPTGTAINAECCKRIFCNGADARYYYETACSRCFRCWQQLTKLDQMLATRALNRGEKPSGLDFLQPSTSGATREAISRWLRRASHEDRTHRGLAKDRPVHQLVGIPSPFASKIKSLPRPGGLHTVAMRKRRRSGDSGLTGFAA